MRKLSIINYLLYSKQNLTVVKENLGQCEDVFKLLKFIKSTTKLQSEEV